MGMFRCQICGDPCAWNSLSLAGMTRHNCPGPPPAPPGGPAVCPYCKTSDPKWSARDLVQGKRGYSVGTGVEYHCTNAFYGAS